MMHRIFRVTLLMLLLSALAACTASSRVVRSYEGPALQQEQVSRLEVPADIRVLSIDGQKQKDYLLENLSLTYELVPGRHTIVYRYESLWSRPGVGGEDAPKTETITSKEQQIVFDFAAGQLYHLSHSEPEDRSAAREYAAGSFQAFLTSESGGTLASGEAYVPVSQPVQVAAAAATTVQPTASATSTTSVAPQSAGMPVAQAAGAGVAVGSAAPAEPGLSRLEALKVLWGQTSAEDKKEFLRWAFQ